MAFNIPFFVVLFLSRTERSVGINCVLKNATKLQSSWDQRSRCYLEITCDEEDCKEELKMGLIDGDPYHTRTAYDHCGYLDNGLYCQCSMDFCSWNIKWLQGLWKRSPTYDPDNEYHDLLEHYIDSQIARRDRNSIIKCFWPGGYAIQSGRLPNMCHFWQPLRCQRYIATITRIEYEDSEDCNVDENDDINCYCKTDFCTSNFTRMMELWKVSGAYNPSLESAKCLEKNAKAQEAYIRRVQGLPLENKEEATSTSTLSATQPTTSTAVKPETTTKTKAESSTTSPEMPYAETDSTVEGSTTIFPRKSEDKSQQESSKIYADKAKEVASDTAVLPIVISVAGDLLIIVGGLLFWLYERQKYMETHKAQGPVVKERSESLLTTASKMSPKKSKMAGPDSKQMSAELARKETETAAKGRTSKESLPVGGSAENAQKTKSAESVRKPGSSEVAAKVSTETKKNTSSVGIAPKQGSKEPSTFKPLR